MIDSKRLAYNERKVSDVVLDGLFGGLAGGVVMGLYLVLWGMAIGRGPGTILGMFDPNEHGAALAGGLTHLAVAAVYGILFGLVWWVLRRVPRLSVPAWFAGAIYGLVLLAIAKSVVLPAAGSPLAEIPALHFAIAHVIYGAALGYLIELIEARPA